VPSVPETPVVAVKFGTMHASPPAEAKRIVATVETNENFHGDIVLWKSKDTVIGEWESFPLVQDVVLSEDEKYSYISDVSAEKGYYYCIGLINADNMLLSPAYNYNSAGRFVRYSLISQEHPQARSNPAPTIPYTKGDESKTPSIIKSKDDVELSMNELILIIVMAFIYVLVSFMWMFFCCYGCISCCKGTPETKTIIYESDCRHSRPSSCRRSGH
jgi:hypothetical protein